MITGKVYRKTFIVPVAEKLSHVFELQRKELY